MTEPDSTSRRRPPTIDLTATEIDAEKPASAKEPGANKPATGEAESNLRQHVTGAVIGAIVVAAIFAGLWIAGYAPSREVAAPTGAQAPKSGAIDEIAARLDKIQGTLQAREPEPALASRMAAAEATTKSLGESLAALNRRVDELATTVQSAIAQAKAAATAAGEAKSAAQTGAQRGDLDALASRIAALERGVKALSDDVARRTSSTDDRAARLTVAAEALRSTVERDAPYQAELAAVKSLGVDQAATAPLEPFAAGGVPSTAALAHELSLLTPALLRASGATRSEGTLLGRLETSAQKLVRITPVDAPPGDEPSAVIARINADATRADIAGAIADIARLPDAAKSLAEPWTRKAAARDAAIAASRRISADALAALNKPNPQ